MDSCLLLLSVVRKRVLISVLCLSVASLAPTPLSACAMLMALPANCAPEAKAANPASHCEQMATPPGSDTDLYANPSALPCCQVSSSPTPDAGSGAAKTTVSSPVASLRDATLHSATIVFERATAASPVQFPSPPDQQSLLCTFLI